MKIAFEERLEGAEGGAGDGPAYDPDATMKLDVPRVLGAAGPAGGPVLICIGGLHGNEPSGVLALQRLFHDLDEDSRGLCGRIIGLTGNRRALACGQRFVDIDLNRAWTYERIERVCEKREIVESEDKELRSLDKALHDAIHGSNQPFVFDLHSTSGDGPAFVTFDDTLRNRALAFEIPAPHVLGLEEELAGTLLGYLNTKGITAVGFESGQHQDPKSVDRALAAIWISMETAGVLEKGTRPEVARARAYLASESAGLPEVVEVRHREPVEEGDGFVMDPGYASFQPVAEGEHLARRGEEDVHADRSGLILMPLYQPQGEDGFFVIQPVRPFWLRLSAALRRVHIEKVVHWLPGVRRHPGKSGVFIVDRRRARWLAREVFHLLGFRKEGEDGEELIMAPRDITTESP